MIDPVLPAFCVHAWCTARPSCFARRVSCVVLRSRKILGDLYACYQHPKKQQPAVRPTDFVEGKGPVIRLNLTRSVSRVAVRHTVLR